MKITFLTCLILCTFTSVFAQDKNDIIKHIDQKVNLINQESDYQIVTLDNEAFLDTAFVRQPGKGYGQLTGYFKNNTLCKIREHLGISSLHDKATTMYYFSDTQLIFVSETEAYGPDLSIDSTGTTDHKIKNADFEGFYYFDGGKIITTTQKGQQQILPNAMHFDSQSKEGQLLYAAEKYRELLFKNKR